MTGRSRGLAMVALVFALGCVHPTVTYPGPRRPENEIVVLLNRDTAIDALDDLVFWHYTSQRSARYEVLPGKHKLTVSLFAIRYQQDLSEVERSQNQIDVCFDFLAGHTYAIGREGAGFDWRPIIVDEATREIFPAPRCDEG